MHTAALQRVAAIAREAGAAELVADADALLTRAHEARFFLACVGEFKRGKSTLINALLGEPVLPTGVVPVTSVPTIVRFGERGARVLERGVWRPIPIDRLGDFVSQAHNPGNAKGVAGVEVFVPHALLREGLCLVDTPGLGSVFEANTASTLGFLPHIDAALMVLGADPPISGEEQRFCAALATDVDTVLVVLNKADRLPAGQRTEAVTFTTQILERTGAPRRIYQVSAIDPEGTAALAADWTALVDELRQLPRRSGQHLVQAAVDRGVRRLRQRLEQLITEEERALLAPLEASDRRIAELTALADAAERTAKELEPLLTLAERELAVGFAERRRAFLAAAGPAAQAELAERLDPNARQEAALALANAIARARLQPWLAESERAAEGAFTAVLDRYEKSVREVVERTATIAGLGVASLAADIARAPSGGGLQTPRGFYFTSLLHYHVSPHPWSALVDRLLPRPIARRRRLAAARRYLAHLLDVNATRVESDLSNRVFESRRRVGAALERVLREAGRNAVIAVARGRQARAAGAEATAQARARLEHWRQRLGTE